jgi:hypothetical protein
MPTISHAGWLEFSPRRQINAGTTLGIAIALPASSSPSCDPQEQTAMSHSTTAEGGLATPIPWREILPWLVFAALALLAIYFVGAEEGATSIIPGMYVHEFVHDGRHLLGFQCH